MVELFDDYKNKIKERLDIFIKNKINDFYIINRWGKLTLEKLYEFIKSGKMIRGGLVIWSYQTIKKDINNTDIIDLALAYEFIQSGFLIHDDIMDKDKNRRGMDTIYYAYEKLGLEEGLNDKEHFGISMGICAGDISFFLANYIISNLNFSENILKKILNYLNFEMNKVVFAQMQDMYFGNSNNIPDIEEIIELYKYKTARYTFSVPFALGAIAAGRSDSQIDLFENIGEYLGIIFQLKDDELGIFGDTQETGKPVGSDIIQKKKTLYFYYLFNSLTGNELIKIKEIFSKNYISQNELNILKNIIVETGIRDKIDNKINYYTNKFLEYVNNDEIKEEEKKFLINLYDFIINRKK